MNITRLFKQYNEQIYRYILSRTGYNTALAEDLTSEVFLKAIKYNKEGKILKESEKSWLYMIARNHIIDFYRQNKQSRVDLEEIPESIKSTPDNNLDSLIEEYDVKLVLECITYLKDQEQEVIRLRYIGELDNREIALVIEKSYSATRQLISRATRKLRKVVEDERTKQI